MPPHRSALPLLLLWPLAAGCPPKDAAPAASANAMPAEAPCDGLGRELWAAASSSEPVTVTVEHAATWAAPAAFEKTMGAAELTKGRIAGDQLCALVAADGVVAVRAPKAPSPKPAGGAK